MDGIPSQLIPWFDEQTNNKWEIYGPVMKPDALGMIPNVLHLICYTPWMKSAQLPRRDWYVEPEFIVGIGRIQHVVGVLGEFVMRDDLTNRSTPVMEFRLSANALWGEVNVARMTYDAKVKRLRLEQANLRLDAANVVAGQTHNLLGTAAYMQPRFRPYLDENWWPDIAKNIHDPQPRKLQAVKDLKILTGLGLKDAKEVIDDYCEAVNQYKDGAKLPTYIHIPQSAHRDLLLEFISLNYRKYYFEQWFDQIENELYPPFGASRNKIMAVKLFMHNSGLGLHDSKDIIDEYDSAYDKFISKGMLTPKRQ